jgi:hypothetical protein
MSYARVASSVQVFTALSHSFRPGLTLSPCLSQQAADSRSLNLQKQYAWCQCPCHSQYTQLSVHLPRSCCRLRFRPSSLCSFMQPRSCAILASMPPMDCRFFWPLLGPPHAFTQGSSIWGPKTPNSKRFNPHGSMMGIRLRALIDSEGATNSRVSTD